jgi:hypothetical protein
MTCAVDPLLAGSNAWVIAIRGCPAMIVSDNGTELISTAMLRWSQERQVERHPETDAAVSVNLLFRGSDRGPCK